MGMTLIREGERREDPFCVAGTWQGQTVCAMH
jgi:hypothetical protein